MKDFSEPFMNPCITKFQEGNTIASLFFPFRKPLTRHFEASVQPGAGLDGLAEYSRTNFHSWLRCKQSHTVCLLLLCGNNTDNQRVISIGQCSKKSRFSSSHLLEVDKHYIYFYNKL